MDKASFIELCKSGDEYALGLLYTNYAPRMKRLCQRYVGDEATAEDIVHDGFIIIMSRIHQLNDAEKIEGWMASIMRNLALRYLAQNGKTVFVPIEEISDNEDFTINTLDIVSEYKELLRLIETLPQGYRSVFKLSVFDGMSHKEIAELLGINPHSSSSQLARAKEMLRTIIVKYGFVPLIVLILLYAIQLYEPKNEGNREWKVVKMKEQTETIDSIYNNVKAYHVNTMKTASTPNTDSTIVEEIDTIKEQLSDTAEVKKIFLPNINDNQLPYNNIADTKNNQENRHHSEEWTASVSYSGAMEANSSMISERPGDISSGDPGIDGSDGGKETVETKTHHYMPFIVSLSLQKSIGHNMSIGTGLRYTRLKTDITTISEHETTKETQKVEYVGIPLSLCYKLWRTGNFSLYTSTGIATDIPVSGSKTWQWSLSIGAGMQYKLTPSISIFAESSIVYHLNSYHGTSTIWTDRPLDITVPIGLRLEW